MSTPAATSAGPADSPRDQATRLAASLFQAALGPGRPADDAESGERSRLPRHFGAYELIEEIGRGGMGVVYRARQTALDRIVAVKLLLAGPYSSEAALRRFQIEAKAAAAQRHPGIVGVHDCGETDGQPFLAMDLIPGRNLADVCAGQPLAARRAARIMVSLAVAVQHAHEHGILHRDLKPSNVLLDDNDAPHITDFGLAGRIDGANLITLTGQALGSPSYTSPEQASGKQSQTGVTTDVYGIGALLYHLLTGRAPFHGSTPTETLQQVLSTEPLPPRWLNPALPRELETICLRCLNKAPEGRYASAAEVAADLNRFLSDQPIRAQPPGRLYRLRKLIQRHRLAFGAASAIAGALVAGTTISTWQAVRATRAEQEQNRLRINEAALRRLAEEQTLAVRRQSYASDLNLIQQVLKRDNITRARELLDRHRPRQGELDLRGWEWRYLWQFCRGDPTIILNDRPLLARQLAASPDGEWLATACHDDAVVEVWSLRTKEHYRVPLPDGAPSVAIAFSPTDPVLAIHHSLGTDLSRGPARLMLWNVATRQVTGGWMIEHRGPHRGTLTFSADGAKLLVAAGVDPSIWTVAEGKLLQRLSKGEADKMSISPAFDRVAIEGPDGSVRLRDLNSGQDQWISGAAREYVSAYAFSPDGKILATAGGGAETTIRLWNAVTGKPLGNLEGHHVSVSKLVFWPDGRTLASGAFDQTIRIWDLATFSTKRTLRAVQGSIEDLVLLPDNRRLASASRDQTVRLWDTVATPAPSPIIQMPDPVLAWTFTPDSQTVVTLDATGRLRRWRGLEFQECEEVALPGLSPLAFRNWNPPFPQGAFISTDPPLGATLTAGGEVQVWNWTQRNIQATIPASPQPDVAVAVVGLTGDHHRLLLNWTNRLSRASGLSEWDLATGKKTRTWGYDHPGPHHYPQSLVSPDGRYCLVSWCKNPFWDSAKNWGPVQLLDLDRDHLVLLPGAVSWWWKSAAFSPDSRFIALPSPASTTIVETLSLESIKTLPGGGCASFTPDGRRMALTTVDPMAPLQLLDTDTWDTVLSLDVPQGFLFSSGFSPDGNVLAMWSQFNRLVLWRAPTWEEIEAVENTPGEG